METKCRGEATKKAGPHPVLGTGGERCALTPVSRQCPQGGARPQSGARPRAGVSAHGGPRWGLFSHLFSTTMSPESQRLESSAFTSPAVELAVGRDTCWTVSWNTLPPVSSLVDAWPSSQRGGFGSKDRPLKRTRQTCAFQRHFCRSDKTPSPEGKVSESRYKDEWRCRHCRYSLEHSLPPGTVHGLGKGPWLKRKR